MAAKRDPLSIVAGLHRRARRGTSETQSDAMTLATVGRNGQPSARVVLLRGLDGRGFVFYTNTESRKGAEIARHPKVALCLYWPSLGVQVRIEGRAKTLGAGEADAYFASRPRASQVSAWASDQSRPLPSRGVLLKRVAQLERRFRGGPVPRPPHWSGYRVTPARIEIWRNRENRLHDRDLYVRKGQGWKHSLLNP